MPLVSGGIALTAAALPAIGSFVSSLYNNSQESKNLRWQKWAQGVTWQREDNAIQRRVNDLRMAGLSPTLAAGQAAETSPPVRTEAPQMDGSAGITASQMMLSFLKAKEEIATTQAQRKLLEYQAGGVNLDNQRKAHDLQIMVKDGMSSSPSGVGRMGRDLYSVFEKLIGGYRKDVPPPLYPKTPPGQKPGVNSYYNDVISAAQEKAAQNRQREIKNEVDSARAKQISELQEKAKLKAHEESLRNRR